MGMDIHSYIETFDAAAWHWNRGDLFDHGSAPGCKPWGPFDRSYGLFGFLAGMRDHNVPQIHPCRGLPADVSPDVRAELGAPVADLLAGKTDSWARYRAIDEWNGLFGHSWATGAELVGYDFATPMRCTYAHGDDRSSWDTEPCPHEAVDPLMTTVGEYLGEGHLERFREIAAITADPNHVRVVYAFDN